MRDERGLYYHPTLQNRRTRMYVRLNQGRVEYRMWSSEDPDIWERHEWISREVVQKACEVFKIRDPKRNPLGLYDEDIAKALLKEAGLLS
jgi:hypothetical protein